LDLWGDSPRSCADRRALTKARHDHWRSFEPCPQAVAAYLPTFMERPEPFILTVQYFVRFSA